MKNLIAACLLLPLFAISQTKNVVHNDRVFPKTDKNADLEKALASHAQKFHTGNWSWRVYEIQTGPDAGGYQINEGPNSWADLDSRGDLGADHLADWNNNISPLITERGSSGYGAYNADLSTVPLTDYTNKVVVTHIYPKPGMMDKLKDLLKKVKTVWIADNQTVAVYESEASGEPAITIAYRLKNGLKEMADDYRKPFKDVYNTTYGAGSYTNYMQSFSEIVEKRWSEMLLFRPDLSSK